MSLGHPDGLHRVVADHLTPRDCPRRRARESRELVADEGISFEYDDGNGLWISSRETPIYLGFFRKYHPQDYPLSQGLSAKREGSEPATED